MVIEENDAADRLDELVDRAVAGEKVFITRKGKAVIQIVPITPDSNYEPTDDKSN